MAEDTKDKKPAQVFFIKLVLKADRCQFNVVYQSLVLRRVLVERLQNHINRVIKSNGGCGYSTSDFVKQNLIHANIRDVKIILSGELSGKVTVKGLRVTKGARAAIEAQGGSVDA